VPASSKTFSHNLSLNVYYLAQIIHKERIIFGSIQEDDQSLNPYLCSLKFGTMNRNIWLDQDSELPCPSCKEGVLKEAGQELKHQTLASLEENNYYRKGQEAPDEHFLVSEHVQCSRCKDWTTVTYKLSYDVRHVDEHGNELPEIERVFYYPAPHIIDIPRSCPASVTDLLNKSFVLYWVDADSCGNKIRMAIETLMAELGVLPSNAKATLHQRIEEFEKGNPKVGAFLKAIKVLGNSGSHAPTLTKKDLLDAYELTEYSLHQLYKDQELFLTQMSREILQQKGPRP